MQLVRYRTPADPVPRVGVDRAGSITELADTTVGALLALPLDAFRARLTGATGPTRPAGEVVLLPPVDGLTEIWAAGVTYVRSRDARMLESDAAERLYQAVYDADRPELFFKSSAAKAVGTGEAISVRADSEIDVPEPELAVVVNAAGDIVGYTVCNDVSSRSIEGENPLYLPQAKIWLGACAVGPGIRPVWEVADPYALPIVMTIHRAGAEVWRGSAHTGQLHRTLPDLVAHHRRADVFPHGSVLSTGTCVVPDLPFTLRAGDVVRIEIGEVGVLENPVTGLDGMGFLVDRLTGADLRTVPA